MRALVLAAVSLAACAQEPPPPARVTIERFLPPGGAAGDLLSADGLGRFRLGADIRVLETAPSLQHGEFNPNNPDCVETSVRYGDGDVGLLSYSRRLARISVHGDAGIRTTEDISVGSTAAEVLAAYLNAERQSAEYVPAPGYKLFVWTDRENYVGLRFEIGEDERVTAIHAGTDLRNDEGCAGA